MSWILKMAWRDSRGSRKRLLLFVMSMVLGVAALVAINSFGENLERAVDDEAKTLLGADLSFENREAFDAEQQAVIDSLGGEQSRRVSFASMAYFPKSGGTRLSTIRAHDGDYPYYGEIETNPPGVAQTYQQGDNALIDGTLMNQFGVEIGDSVAIGNKKYRVAATLVKTPRETAAIGLFSPRIYIPLARMDTTLLQRGSRAEYEVYFKFNDGRDIEAMMDENRSYFRELGFRWDTVEEEREDWSEALRNLYRFLSLVGFMALLLGSLGVASAVHVYVKQRVETVAVLRVFGAKSWRTFGVYLVQALAMGIVGSVIGCLIGIGVQFILPEILGDVLPVDVALTISWSAVLLGLGIGIGVTVLFALLPLLSVRNISPLRALRASYEPEKSPLDPFRLAAYALIAFGVVAFAIVQAPTPMFGVWYAVGVAVVFLMLAGVARLITYLTRRFFPSGWTYVWRQGLANLYRPNNQTLLLMLALGLGTFLVMTLFLTQETLTRQVEISGGGERPNLVFFDIQTAQLEGLRGIVEEQERPVMEEVPIVTMRIQSIRGRTIDELRADSTVRVRWAYTREYRSTYRDFLTEAETVLEGTYETTWDEGEPVPISMEADIKNDLGLELGDEVTFDVQGVPVRTRLSSVREVDWQRLQTNFYVVFPPGVLEQAPQFSVLLTRVPDEAASAALQRAVVQEYPNVSSIDLSLILDVFDTIFGRIAFVIRFMALFSILTGLIVLAGAVIVSRSQRVEESVLLKTLGASRKQVRQIMLVEYLFLGVFATMTGLLLAIAGSWALAFFVFETAFVAPLWSLALSLVLVVGLTMLIGVLSSRGVYDRPPLEVLRVES